MWVEDTMDEESEGEDETENWNQNPCILHLNRSYNFEYHGIPEIYA